MLTWTDLQTKAVRQCRDTTSGTLTQLQQDMNTSYHLFNAKLSRYFSRKQQFADIVENQYVYQTPLDAVRVTNITFTVGSGNGAYKQVLKEIRSEDEWRVITAYQYGSNWPEFYIMLGNDQFQVWPTPTQSVTQGIRFVYQQQDNDLTIQDLTSTSTSATVTVSNGSTLVTATSGIFATYMTGLQFQLTGTNDLSWYEIIAVPSATTLTLKSAFIGLSGSALPWRIGQTPIIPQEYHDSLTHYALSLFYSSKGDEARANDHMTIYNNAVAQAIEDYSSANVSSVITDDENYISAWTITPLPGI